MFRTPRSLSVLEQKTQVFEKAMAMPGRLEKVTTKEQIEKLRVIHERLARLNDKIVDTASKIETQIKNYREKKTDFTPPPEIVKVIPPSEPRQMQRVV